MKLKLVTAKMNTPQDTTVVDFVHFIWLNILIWRNGQVVICRIF